MSITETPTRNDTEALNALAAASSLYERYLDLVQVANIAAISQTRPTAPPHVAAPLGLVVWPRK